MPIMSGKPLFRWCFSGSGGDQVVVRRLRQHAQKLPFGTIAKFLVTATISREWQAKRKMDDRFVLVNITKIDENYKNFVFASEIDPTAGWTSTSAQIGRNESMDERKEEGGRAA